MLCPNTLESCAKLLSPGTFSDGAAAEASRTPRTTTSRCLLGAMWTTARRLVAFDTSPVDPVTLPGLIEHLGVVDAAARRREERSPRCGFVGSYCAAV